MKAFVAWHSDRGTTLGSNGSPGASNAQWAKLIERRARAATRSKRASPTLGSPSPTSSPPQRVRSDYSRRGVGQKVTLGEQAQRDASALNSMMRSRAGEY